MPIDAGSLPTGGTLAFVLFDFMLYVYVFGSLVMGLVSVLVWFRASQPVLDLQQQLWVWRTLFCLFLSVTGMKTCFSVKPLQAIAMMC